MGLEHRPKQLLVATDGSGGEFSSDRRLRSCGWGAVWLRNNPRLEASFGLCGSLPFPTQTVPLAELFALWQVVRWSPLADLVSIFADASYVVSNFNKGRQHCLSHVSHAFLWGAIFDRVEELSGLGVVVVVSKVKAHNEGGINSENADRTFGNIVVDSLADAAAEFLWNGI
jgi:hypothetical protein